MILTIRPVEHLRGIVDLPSSKSYSIRAFIIASCGGRSIIHHPSNCDDAIVAMNVARSFGAKLQHMKKKFVKIDAFANPLNISTINVKESGTVLRFVLPLVSLYKDKAIINGEGTLTSRPNLHLTQALRNLGVVIRGKGNSETVPIYKEEGCIKGGKIEIDGSLSSQFVSAFLIACPQLKEDSWVKVFGKKMVSQTYITMTLQILEKSGIEIKQKSPRLFFVKGNQKYTGFKKFTVPADYGLAAFFLAAGTLLKSQLTLRGSFRKEFVQSDGEILKFLRLMGVLFEEKSRGIKIVGPSDIKGGNFSLKNCPDLIPIMSILALFARGRTRLYNIGHAKVKESDRIGDLRNELLKVGASIIAKSDEMIIYPQKNYHRDCLLDPHHDHRLAMAFAILGLKLGIKVKDIECTKKSYPDFVQDLRILRVPLNLSKD